MSMIRWQPFSELLTLRQAMDKLFEDSYVSPSRLLSAVGVEAVAPIDMYQTDKDVVVKVSLPGVKQDGVDITITGDTLTVKGEAKAEKKVKQEDYFYQERRYGAFSRAVTLPEGLGTDKAEANFEDGVLTLTIPKSEKVKPKEIKIKAKAEEKK